MSLSVSRKGTLFQHLSDLEMLSVAYNPQNASPGTESTSEMIVQNITGEGRKRHSDRDSN